MERPNYSFEEYSDPGYSAFTTEIEGETKDVYVTLKNPKNYEKSITELLEIEDYYAIRSYDADAKYDYQLNSELLRWEAFSFSNNISNVLTSIAGVIIAVIIITSVYCIKNSFAISITEKMKMYGELASVGATKKQIKKSVIYEGMTLGLVGVPVGIISGIFAIFILLKIVSALIGEFLFEGIEGIIFSVNIIAIIISTILGFITIYLSAFFSAKRASKVNPIELLRNSAKIKIKPKKLKAPIIIKKVFKTGGILAYKNLKRSKKKYRTTVVSIAISISIFIIMSAFINNMFEFSSNYYQEYTYNMIVSCEEEEIKNVISQEDIDEYYLLYSAKDYSYLKIYDKTKIENDEFDLDEDGYMPMEIIGYDDATYRKYVKKAGLNYDKVKDSGLLIDNYTILEREGNETKETKKRTYNYKEGDTIIGKWGKTEKGYGDGKYSITHENDKNINIKIGAITETRPYGKEQSFYYGGYLIVNIDRLKDIDYEVNKIIIQSSNPDRLEETLSKSESIYVTNIAKEIRAENAMVLVVKIFLYGFISVITLIGVTNIFNTITSNMELRQKEFAMLKSVGMTKREFNRMINLETIFYGTKSLLYGIVLGMIGTYLLYISFGESIEEFSFPGSAVVISFVSVFVLIFMIMKYSLRKINKQNTIETIRKDNI